MYIDSKCEEVTNHRGETVGVRPKNIYNVKAGDKIAQLVLAPVTTAEIAEVTELSETERGTGGFGSTGR